MKPLEVYKSKLPFKTFWRKNDLHKNISIAYDILAEMSEKLLGFRPINERLSYLRMSFKLSILNMYDPENYEKESKEKNYERLEEEIYILVHK